MPLQDYSYIAPVGFNCMPAWQLRREAQESGLARERVRGPFDWLILPLAAAVYAVETDFREFLRPETLALESDPGGDHWRLGDAQGVHAWHHVPRATGDISVTAASWRGLDDWRAKRLAHWHGALADPAGNVLLLRLEDAAVPDDPGMVARLAAAVRERARARVTVAAISYDTEKGRDSPGIRAVAVARTWPHDLPVDRVEWDRDYGAGVAWRGHDASWRALCKRL